MVDQPHVPAAFQPATPVVGVLTKSLFVDALSGELFEPIETAAARLPECVMRMDGAQFVQTALTTESVRCRAGLFVRCTIPLSEGQLPAREVGCQMAREQLLQLSSPDLPG